MFLEFTKPVPFGPAAMLFNSSHDDIDRERSFQALPINLSPEEIRAMVLEVLG